MILLHYNTMKFSFNTFHVWKGKKITNENASANLTDKFIKVVMIRFLQKQDLSTSLELYCLDQHPQLTRQTLVTVEATGVVDALETFTSRAVTIGHSVGVDVAVTVASFTGPGTAVTTLGIPEETVGAQLTTRSWKKLVILRYTASFYRVKRTLNTTSVSFSNLNTNGQCCKTEYCVIYHTFLWVVSTDARTQ